MGQTATVPVGFVKTRSAGGCRVVLYGEGGVGKTTLALHAPAPVAFFDLDDSLPVLAVNMNMADVLVVEADSFETLTTKLRSPGWESIRTIVIDTATKAEEMALTWVLANVPHDKGYQVYRIEDYGYGKGYQHVYDTFLLFLATLDNHVRAGRNVILVCHECVSEVPNPAGDDWKRHEPRLQASPRNSLRHKVKEWADHLLFYGFDKGDVKDGKMRFGFTSRTIYPIQTPHCMAKSRTLRNVIPILHPDNPELWPLLFGQKGQ